MNVPLCSSLSFDALDYGVNRTAIFGIPNSGKTVTAKKIAEGLMLAGIPIIVFDPAGNWKFLREGKPGHSGFPVIVAGPEGSCSRS